MKKILIAGIGGTGGFFGGKLAAHYFNSNDIEVYFLCRGENLKTIQKNGLEVKSEGKSFIVHPKLATNDPQEIGIADLLICCTKAYDLESTLKQIDSCIDRNTVILPLQNGVDSFDHVQQLYTQNEVWRGCVYIVAHLEKPGLVIDSGPIRKLFFGTVNQSAKSNEKLLWAEDLMKSAGIDASNQQNILQTIWEKFIFISTMASITSYKDQTIGQLVENPESMKLLNSLLSEIRKVANANGIVFDETNIENAIARMKSLSYETSSSMHRDYQNKKKTEVETLTGYVVRLGKKSNIETPAYEMVYQKLKQE
ncbi:ketopantoate reductase family protein [Daejeonella oryzae]|uniref:ketopantoate reductase family protein n=1 Tax=Daejeonella oryzae TaxID=1122943 RepID=UPI0003FE3F04|nr:2-dehydropantoate 2-reductase [Daejeonella oryzae]